jgi:hypothetical protein
MGFSFSIFEIIRFLFSLLFLLLRWQWHNKKIIYGGLRQVLKSIEEPWQHRNAKKDANDNVQLGCKQTTTHYEIRWPYASSTEGSGDRG